MLVVNEEDAEVIRVIFDQYINSDMGAIGVAKYLNQKGYVKKARQKNHLSAFSSDFVKDILDNPVYCGKIAYGRRSTKKKTGVRNETHVVKQKEFHLYDGIYEAIISEEDWYLAHEKRLKDMYRREKIYSLQHEHALSGILVCPVCGGKMYGNVSRKRKKYFQAFVERVEVHENSTPKGQILKRVVFNLPLIYDNQPVTEISWDNLGHVESVVLLERTDSAI